MRQKGFLEGVACLHVHIRDMYVCNVIAKGLQAIQVSYMHCHIVR